MPITAQQLLQILPNAGKQAGVFASALCARSSVFPQVGLLGPPRGQAIALADR